MIIQNTLIILSMLFSLISFLNSYCTNIKRYELTGEYRKRILAWFGDTLYVFKKIALAKNEPKEELLVKLSTQLDIERFHFPNSEKNDGKLENNPSALRGYLNVIIDTLVFYCHLLKLDNHNSKSERFKRIERIFISQFFNQLNHNEYINLTKKLANHEFYYSINFEALEYNYFIEIDYYLKRKNVLEKSNIRFFNAIFKKRLILN